jgi:pimeloyl-ACP methyl ester carboxylesterase
MSALSAANSLADTMHLSACALPGADSARCGSLDVAENPREPRGRRLSIHFAVIPAKGVPLPDPIAILMGGPGEDAIGSAGFYADQLSALRSNRDILLVDQRGAGLSGALPCQLFSDDDPGASLRDVFPPTAVESCAGQLRLRADLTQYGYLRFADDLEAVRRALGYGPLNLFAGSYGTRAVQVYVRSYPKNTRTIYFGSVVPIDVATPLPFAKTAQGAMEGLFDACAADAACHRAFPKLRDEFHQIFARLETGEVRVQVPNHPQRARLYRGRVAEWIRAKLYRPSSAVALPWMIHQAFLDNWTPMVDGILSDARRSSSELSFGLFFAITCSEDVRFEPQVDPSEETQATFLKDYRLLQQQAACRYWPKESLPENYRLPVHSSVPALFVSGDADGATPLWYAEHAASGFEHHVRVVVHGQGHTEWNDCVSRLYQRLVREGALSGAWPADCGAVPRPPFEVR